MTSTTNEVTDHYQKLLAHHYTWMFGSSFEAKVAEQRAILEQILASPASTNERRTAVDLGSGPGFQAIALAEMGFSPVLAVDTSEALLNELATHRASHTIETIHADIRQLPTLVSPNSAQVITCMGDTITHLEAKEDVVRLLQTANTSLASSGSLIISYRDLSAEASGLDRFIPVYSDEQRVMTCFLEFHEPDRVRVHDLIYNRTVEGWKLEKGSYNKLRLSVEWLTQAMNDSGFTVERTTAGRLICLVGKKLS